MTYTKQELEEMMKRSGGSLDLRGTQITELPDNLTVGGSLDLSGTQITELPDNLTVGGWLDLSGTQITELPDNLTVGGWLDLRGTQITELPDNLTVGGSLDLRGTAITDKIAAEKKVLRLIDGMERPGKWLYADGILTHVKQKKKINDYIFYVGKIKGKNVIFDGKVYAHCKSLKEGIQDLEFKHAKARGAEQYRGISLDKEFTPDEAVTMYRIITGACRQGSESFVKSLGKLKDKYTLKEIIEITDGQYNSSSFKAFFERGEEC